MASEITEALLPPDFALSYRDISRGRLNYFEGNIFTMLDPQNLRQRRRCRKRSAKPFVLAMKNANSTCLLHENTTYAKGNPYQDLYIPETTFLDLPPELRNKIFEEVVVECDSRWRDERDHQGYCCENSIVIQDAGKATGHFDKLKFHESLLLVNKQINLEWRTFLNHHVPLHMWTTMTFKKLTDNSTELELGTLRQALPLIEAGPLDSAVGTVGESAQGQKYSSTCNARGLFLAIDCWVTGWAFESEEDDTDITRSTPSDEEEEHADTTEATSSEAGEDQPHTKAPRTSEEEINFHLITSSGFEDLCNRLRLCEQVEDLIVQWDMRSESTREFESHAVASSGVPNVLFDSLIQVIEAMPNLKRYCVDCRTYAMFASRADGEAWSAEGTLRLSHETVGGCYYDTPCEELYQDLNKD
ncbi:hypothetical protein AC578_2624 [Pseudocercospora eumusae]|uniref:Uncharacterized protein n=1 Tax=Pseudocercospora eumusae TaxID=321146 RepID=A0A139H7Q9_9PEZI|nr:hypothetical protein AC578_2624 [Pseudocercospora eumusae]